MRWTAGRARGPAAACCGASSTPPPRRTGCTPRAAGSPHRARWLHHRGRVGWTSSKYGLACDNLHLGRGGPGRRTRWCAPASGARRPVLGPARRRRQLRHRHRVRVPLAPARPDRARRAVAFPVDRAPEVLRAAGATGPTPRPTRCPPGVSWSPRHPEPVRPGGAARPAGTRRTRALRRRSGGRAAAVQPLRDLGPAVDHVGPMPYTAFQAVLDPLAPCGPAVTPAASTCPSSATPRSGCSSPTPPTWSARARRSARWSSSGSGRASRRCPGEATAFSHRDARYLFHPISSGPTPPTTSS